MHKAVLSSIAFAGVASLFLLGTAPRADAATTCYEGGCNGQAAANTTCANDAEVIYSVNIYRASVLEGYLELKYSPSCRAAWARVISYLPNGSWAQINSNYDPGLSEFCPGGSVPGTGCNTTMIDDANPYTSYATGGVYDSFGNDFQVKTASY